MRRAAVALGIALSLFAGGALAQPKDAGPSEADTLLATIDAEVASLSTEDCTSACHALESMRRAAERLCAIEPARCRSAEDKVKGAQERVRAACPGCSATTPTPEMRPAEPTVAPPPASPPSLTSDGAREAQAAPGKHGGCAGCATASNEDLAPPTVGFAFAALVFALRRRAKREEGSRKAAKPQR